MKKTLCIALAAALLLAFAACGAPAARDTLTGAPEEIIAQLKESPGAELGMTLDSEVTAENAQNALGLTEAQFTEYVESAYEAMAAINAIAQSNVLVKCKDIKNAAEVKRLIADGFNSQKWICVFPEKCAVVESGSYILLTVGAAETVDALVEAFKDLSGGNIGTPNVFYESDGGDIGGGGDLVLF